MAQVSMSDIWSEIDLSERTSELFDELKMLFGSVDAIPIEVFLTGACMQISSGLTTNLTALFEEFLSKWKFLDDDLYVYPKEERTSSQCSWQSALDSAKYLEAIEVFTVTILGKMLHKPELAIAWTEMADLPEEKRQDILRRLRLFTTNAGSSLDQGAIQNVDSVEPPPGFTPFAEAGKSNAEMNRNVSNLAALKTVDPSVKCITHWRHHPLSWFSTIRLKFGSIRLVFPAGKAVLLGLFVAFASYSLRKKSSALKQFARRQALWMQKTLLDAWQLAFSVQVNPLAAVQQLPAAPRGTR
ncbi:hypothetical protein AXF42_Ash012417 [Apostasia shenzhenica]|uniref:Uncharacterized protein n=1 Tax=Apostasia shenzhenica TaxID=1088818 RepID=A0A2I0AQS2_9ASPA|nr:hypothetical protein AXF42_Ash012417 [Apostasia shenzhenica]